jgi:TRAP-type uncharacterized transport system substrate-binding protein
MLGLGWPGLLKGLAAILCILGIVSLALIYFFPAPPSKFTIVTGGKNQIYESIGNKYREIIARSDVDVEVRLTNGAVENIKLLNDPTSGIKAGIVQGVFRTAINRQICCRWDKSTIKSIGSFTVRLRHWAI